MTRSQIHLHYSKDKSLSNIFIPNTSGEERISYQILETAESTESCSTFKRRGVVVLSVCFQ